MSIKGNNLLDTCIPLAQDVQADQSGRLWSLLGIMRKYELETLTRHLMMLVEDRNWCQRVRMMDGPDKAVPAQAWQDIWERYRELMDLASAAEFQTAFASVDAIRATYSDDEAPDNMSALESDLRHVADMFLRDIEHCAFLSVPSRLRHFVDNDTLFGPSVAKSFPSARVDIKEAGNCLAADCNTAAVFHLMRAVEWALRALGAHLGFRQLRARRQSGAKKYTPVSHLEWERVIDQLQVRVDKRIETMRPGRRKQGLQEFYYPALQDIRGIRDAWRNHVMHSRAEYSAEDALAVMRHVERLMVKLATRVSES